MGERNDLIRELTDVAQDRHGAKNTHLLSWLEKGYFHCQHGSEEWCQGDYLDSARAYIERLEAVAKDALTIIASLSEALAEAEKKGAEDWQPIETAPRDGTSLDLWSSEFGRHTDCHWGKPEHCCGEAGRYCDSDWHTEPEGWVDGVLNVILSDPDEFTHWRPLPAPPRDLSQGGQHG